jgi:hypothetical protein
MKLVRISVAHIQVLCVLLLGCGSIPAWAQFSDLKGLTAVRVSVTWNGGTASERETIQAAVELSLRQAGLFVPGADLSPEAQSAMPLLSIGIAGNDKAIPIAVELQESAIVTRDWFYNGGFAAVNAFVEWYASRTKQPTPITKEEIAEHSKPDLAALASTPPRRVTTWRRYSVAESAQPETVQQIIARYASHPYMQTPAGRPIVQHWMDLEVQAAMANAQRPASPATVRDTIKAFVDAFLNEWLAANPKPK